MFVIVRLIVHTAIVHDNYSALPKSMTTPPTVLSLSPNISYPSPYNYVCFLPLQAVGHDWNNYEWDDWEFYADEQADADPSKAKFMVEG